MSVTTDTDDVTPVDDCILTRSEIIETLNRCNVFAKRQMCVVEKFTTDPPTEWSKAHQRIDQWINDLERAPR